MRSCTRRRVAFLDVCVSIDKTYFVIGNSKPSQLGFAITQLPNLLSSGLSNLLLQPLAYVANALILVWIRRTQGAHFRGNLPDFLAINARDGQSRLFRINRNLDSAGQRVF